MHVLIATSGVLGADQVVEFTRRLIGGDGKVTVTTVIEVPRSFLDQLGADDWNAAGSDARPSPTQESVVERYVEERGRRMCEPLLNALEGEGIPAASVYLEGEDPAATISGLATKLEADVVLLGATRPIFHQSAWESVSARVTLECARPVLVLPPPVRVEAPEED
ncbi:MAG: universal stress protein [Acidimicrobiia bacterium]|nr:universal stress protein [Acidimicrobiia bacterium]